MTFFDARARNCLISTSGLKVKSDVSMVFRDPDFLYGAGIPAIREHYWQKLSYIFIFIYYYYVLLRHTGSKIEQYS